MKKLLASAGLLAALLGSAVSAETLKLVEVITSPERTEVLKGSLASDTGFDGQGGSKQSNSLEGDVTVAVVKRLSNGNLFVRGQKWIGINQGQEFIRVQGVIRPIDIQPDNSVPSYKVANAMISYGGKGALANANKQGLLARFFNSPWMPF